VAVAAAESRAWAAQRRRDALSEPHHLPDRAIPWRDHAPTALDYSAIPVDLGDPRAGEPLVDLAALGVAGSCYYARTDGLNAPYYRAFASASPGIWCRRSVADRLAAANQALTPYGVELYVLNAYRPVALQEELWAYFMAQARAVLDHPDEAACIAFAGEYCSDPEHFDPADSRTWPTHATGGAVDTTLRLRGTGELLYMGGIFDDPSEVSHTAHLERRLADLSESGHAALRNRRLLYWTMRATGFANYPYEWWHYDWGTQLWALDSQRSGGPSHHAAWYGPAGTPG
jgi:D-alanyl-D-alanine dipeptidase